MNDKLKAIRRELGNLTNELCFLADVCERYEPDPGSGYTPCLAGLAALMNGFAARTEEMSQQVRGLIDQQLPAAKKPPRRRPELVSTEGPLDRAARELGYGRDVPGDGGAR
jgi:hypothetical protein